MTSTRAIEAVDQQRQAASRSATRRPPRPPSLAELQALMQRAIVADDDGLLAHLVDSPRTTRDVLLGVYRHAYGARLVEVVRNEHPALATYLGDETFEEMARAFVAAHPSTSPNARWVSQPLPEFLGDAVPYRAHRQLRELAQLERALNRAFDSADIPLLTLAALAEIPPANWAALTLTPHVCVTRLDHATNAFDIWRALTDSRPPPPVEVSADHRSLVVWRDGVLPKVRRLAYEEAMLWDVAARGLSFGVMCEMAAVYAEPEQAPQRVAGYLQGWIGSGMLSGAG